MAAGEGTPLRKSYTLKRKGFFSACCPTGTTYYLDWEAVSGDLGGFNFDPTKDHKGPGLEIIVRNVPAEIKLQAVVGHLQRHGALGVFNRGSVNGLNIPRALLKLERKSTSCCTFFKKTAPSDTAWVGTRNYTVTSLDEAVKTESPLNVAR